MIERIEFVVDYSIDDQYYTTDSEVARGINFDIVAENLQSILERHFNGVLDEIEGAELEITTNNIGTNPVHSSGARFSILYVAYDEHGNDVACSGFDEDDDRIHDGLRVLESAIADFKMQQHEFIEEIFDGSEKALYR